MGKKIAILASGSGTNAENLIKYFQNSENAEVSLVLSNNADAYVLERAEKHHVKNGIFNKKELNNADYILGLLEEHAIDYIILAGFLLLIPKYLIEKYSNKIINIHPALLPEYGGKGMYGRHVHQSIIANNEAESGITIHLVNEKFDDGKILFQAKCIVNPSDTPEILAQKIHELEQIHFPKVVENFILNVK